jgi:hypothetical protein
MLRCLLLRSVYLGTYLYKSNGNTSSSVARTRQRIFKVRVVLRQYVCHFLVHCSTVLLQNNPGFPRLSGNVVALELKLMLCNQDEMRPIPLSSLSISHYHE